MEIYSIFYVKRKQSHFIVRIDQFEGVEDECFGWIICK